MTDNTAPWNGIPDDPQTSGWHWIGWEDYMEARFWESGYGWEFPSGMMIHDFSKVEYLGPAIPPVSRCRYGSRRVAVSARFIRDHDQVGVTMSDGSNHYLDGYYWHNDKPVFEIVGKTIPEIDAAAKQYRDPKQEDPAQK